MVQRVSVRRAQIEEKRARKQVLIAGIVAVVVGSLFLFVVVPLMLRGVIFIAQRTSPITQDEEQAIPPQAPVIGAPAEYNNTGVLELAGFTRANTEVTLIVNEQERDTTRSNAEGAFSFAVNLGEGEYELYLYATGDDKNTSPDSARYNVVVDRTVPRLEVTDPVDGTVLTLRREQNITVKGTLSEVGFVMVNSSRVRTNADGEFQTQIQLGEGENTITFRGEDLAGNQSVEETRNVTWNP